MTRQIALQTCGLNVGYGRRCVVGGVTLDLVPGEVLCLVGPNGSGKSTLLKTIAGQIAPLGGTVLLDGRDASSFKADELARSLSVMLTGRMACEMLSCLDVVETGRIPYTNALGTLREADREAVRGAMQAVGAWELRERDFMQISDGQRQRVLLARAIAQDAPVMALDEPTSYLDIRHQLELLARVRDLARTRGWTCLLSLHELALAQKVAYMRKAPPRTCLTRPRWPMCSIWDARLGARRWDAWRMRRSKTPPACLCLEARARRRPRCVHCAARVWASAQACCLKTTWIVCLHIGSRSTW